MEHRARPRGGVDEFGALLGPERTPAVGWWGFLVVAAPGLDRLTHRLPCWGVWVWWWCGGFGVWWCVECCIVDASIFLCLVLWFVRVCCV